MSPKKLSESEVRQLKKYDLNEQMRYLKKEYVKQYHEEKEKARREDELRESARLEFQKQFRKPIWFDGM